MKILKKILWAVDFNQEHEISTAKLSNIYDNFSNELIILNVLPENLKSSSYHDIVEKATIAELGKLKDKLCLNKEIKVTTLIKYGSIVDTIIDVAEAENVNVIFVNQGNGKEGKHNKIGINAFNTLLYSHKPVVVIAEELKDEKESNTVFCPVDFSEPSEQALKNAILYSKVSGKKLIVAAVFKPFTTTSARLQNHGIKPEEENALLLNSFKKDFDSFLSRFNFLDIEFEKLVLKGDVVSEIVTQANKAEITYLGSTGKTGLKRLLLGSTTEKVVQEMPSNMVIIKSEDLFKLQAPTNMKDVNNHFSIANQFNELGYYKKAAEHYKECLNLNAMHLPSVLELSKLYKKLGNDGLVVYYDELYSNIMQQFNNWKIQDEIRRSIR